MCGIFAYIGEKNAAPILLEGLKRLEYRGYDSWGMAVLDNQSIFVRKKAGKISTIEHADDFPKSHTGIAHTRWATHGGITDINAHPHSSSDHNFVLAQNGIVQNYETLREQLLQKKYQFISETDTEVIVRLIEDKLKLTENLQEAIRLATLDLEGRNTIIVLAKDGRIIASRNGSPLVVGLNEKSDEVFISSDTLSFAPFAQKMIVIDNGQMIVCQGKNIQIFDTKTSKNVKPKIEMIDIKSDKVDKEGHPHFLIKEIFDTPKAIKQLIRQDRHEFEKLSQAIHEANRVYTVGSGTAGVAAAQIAYYLREVGKINAVGLIGADAQEYYPLFTSRDLIIAPSQSGETADVLEVLEMAKKKNMRIASYVNMPGSMMTRMSDFKFMAQAGPEISVVSTKIFTSQIAWGYLVAKTVTGDYEDGLQKLNHFMNTLQTYLHDEKNHGAIVNLAEKLENEHDVFMLGKGQNFFMIKEGMVKLIECTYKHAHAMPAGDLKHYAITLMQPGATVIVAVSDDHARSDVVNAINEVKARGSTVIGISHKPEKCFSHHIQVPDTGETSAMMNVIPLQLLAYYLGIELGNDVDKPRNIAKSVTVK